jgi:Phosphotransferase enzyme family
VSEHGEAQSHGGPEHLHHHPMEHEGGALAASLSPALIEACGGRLSQPTWFRAAWQASGSSTGYATYRDGDGRELEVVVKVPVNPNEHRWTSLLGNHGGGAGACTPRVLAHGLELGGYDFAWLVIEKLRGSPLNKGLDKSGVEGLLMAASSWYVQAGAARAIATAPPPKDEDWGTMLDKARHVVKDVGMAESQRWNEALHRTQKHLGELVARWRARPINTWCHGDLHPGNAMRRESADGQQAGCVLIDLALVHPGHWVEDAVYLERLYWAKPELLGGVKPVSEVAKNLRSLGTIGGEDYAMLAHVRRVLMAASVPLYLEHEGHPKYVKAALEMLERTMGVVGM